MTTEPSPCHAGGNSLAASYFVDYWSAEEYTEYMGMFYYVTNAQGDVTALVSETGELLVTYDYDAWGKPVRTDYYEVYTDYGLAEASQFVSQNPFRYRGYVYDTETGLYYLQSRYYDPEVGRFINVDSYFSTGTGLLGNNMFSYCNNNPACCLDACGTRPVSTLEGFEGLPVPPPQRKRKRNNDDAVADFFEVSSWEDIPNLPDGAMLFVENITSVSVGTFVSAIRGKALVMDRDKYCVYTFVGLSFGIGGVSNALLDKTCTKGYVYGVEDIGDYSGIFFGGSSNMVSSVEGGAWAPNGVYAEIIGGVNVVASVGGSAAWYSTTQTDWIYGAADYYVVPNVYSRSPLDTNKIF